MNQSLPEPAATGCDVRGQLRLAGVCLVWGILFAGGMMLIKHELLPAGPLPWLIALLPSVAGVFVLLEYVRFLRRADELQRLIQLQAMAWGFGGGFLAICGYSLFEQLGAPSADAAGIVAVMPILYAVASLVGAWRYR